MFGIKGRNTPPPNGSPSSTPSSPLPPTKRARGNVLASEDTPPWNAITDGYGYNGKYSPPSSPRQVKGSTALGQSVDKEEEERLTFSPTTGWRPVIGIDDEEGPLQLQPPSRSEVSSPGLEFSHTTDVSSAMNNPVNPPDEGNSDMDDDRGNNMNGGGRVQNRDALQET